MNTFKNIIFVGFTKKHFMVQTKTILVFILTLGFKITIAQEYFTVNGSTTIFPDGAKIIIKSNLPYRSVLNYPQLIDSAIIKNHRFEFIIKSNSTELYIFTVKTENKEVWTKLFLQPSNTYLILNDSTLNSVKILKNKSASEYILFEKEIKNIKGPDNLKKLWSDYQIAIDNNDTTNRRRLDIIFFKIKDSMEAIQASLALNWVSKKPLSFINSYIIYYFLKDHKSEQYLKQVFYKLPNRARQNSWSQELDYFFNRLTIGRVAPNFIQADTNSIAIELANFRGKFVLLDFWAAWCIPCREKTPSLIRVYEKFNHKNFEIISISLDKNRKEWVNAIIHDNLTWINISDLKVFDNEVVRKYGLTAIPFNILIDPKGVIIAKNIWGSQLLELLTNLVK